MTTLSLTKLFGAEKSRQIKKGLMYGLIVAAAITIVSWVWFFYSIILLSKGVLISPATMNVPEGGAKTVAEALRWVYLIVLLYSPVLIFAGTRIWYKYAHAKERRESLEVTNNELWGMVNGERGELINQLSGAFVKDQGNYRDDLRQGYTEEDMARIIRERVELEEFEKGKY